MTKWIGTIEDGFPETTHPFLLDKGMEKDPREESDLREIFNFLGGRFPNGALEKFLEVPKVIIHTKGVAPKYTLKCNPKLNYHPWEVFGLTFVVYEERWDLISRPSGLYIEIPQSLNYERQPSHIVTIAIDMVTKKPYRIDLWALGALDNSQK